MEPFADRLRAATSKYGPLCAGIDPSRKTLTSWGLDDDPTGLETFVEISLEGALGCVGVIKPQVAFFERFGIPGLLILQELFASARAHGLLVIADAKRSDISSTAEAYGAAWLGADAPFGADALTVTPYLGLDALEPIFSAAAQATSGIFVVVSSSNEEGRGLQTAAWGGGSVEEHLLKDIGRYNDVQPGETVGAVIGVTREPNPELVAAMAGPLLLPGFGEQGGSAEELRTRFSGLPNAMVVSVSRAWSSAGPNVGALAIRSAELQDQLRGALG